MDSFFHFDVAGALTFCIGAIAAGAAYYVRTSIQLAGNNNPKLIDAEARLEALGTKLIERIDGVKDAVNSVNVTIGRADERITQAVRDIDRLDTRLAACEQRWSTRANSI